MSNPPDTATIMGPDGKLWDIPAANYATALSKGGRAVTPVIGPDKQQWWIPNEHLKDALDAGGTLAPGVPAFKSVHEGFFHRLRDMLANSAVGRSLESELPQVANTLGLTPTETVNSPTNKSDAEQFLAPQYLISPDATGKAANISRGVAQFAGGATNAQNLLYAAIPFGEFAKWGPTAAKVIPRLVSAGFGTQMIAGAARAYPEVKNALEAGDYDHATQLLTQLVLQGALGAGALGHGAGLFGHTAPIEPQETLAEPNVSIPDQKLAQPGQAQAPPESSTLSSPPGEENTVDIATQLGMKPEEWAALPPDRQRALAALPTALRAHYRAVRAAQMPIEAPEAATPTPQRLDWLNSDAKIATGDGWSLNQVSPNAVAFTTLNDDGSPQTEMLLTPVDDGKGWRVSNVNAAVERQDHGLAAYRKLREVARDFGIKRIYAGDNQSAGGAALWRKMLESGEATLDDDRRPFLDLNERQRIEQLPPGVPRFVQGAKPRYGYGDKLFELDFESPIDKALYTVAQTKKNASHDATMTWLRSLWPGTSDNDIVAKGQEVRTLIKGLAKDANPGDGPLRVPSSSPSQSPLSAPAGPLIAKGKTYTLHQEDPHTFQLRTTDANGDPTAQIFVRQSNPETWQVVSSTVAKERTGLGRNAIKLRNFQYKQLRRVAAARDIKTIESDTSLSPAAKGLWDSLLKSGDAHFDQTTGRYFMDLRDPRLDPELRAAIDKLSPPDRAKAIAAERRVRAQTREEQLTDPLTGIHNRDAFARMPQAPFYAVLDLDSFKAINDNLGHPVGNVYLRQAAQALKNAGLDVYRTGGDEFTIRGDDPEKMAATLDKVRDKLSKGTVRTNDASGKPQEYPGPDFHYGIGSTEGEADRELLRLKSGAKRGEFSESYRTRIAPEGGNPPGANGAPVPVETPVTEGPANPLAGEGTVKGAENGVPRDLAAAATRAEGRNPSGMGEGGIGEHPLLEEDVQHALAPYITEAKARGAESIPIEEAVTSKLRALYEARANILSQLRRNPNDLDLQRAAQEVEAERARLEPKLVSFLQPEKQAAYLRDAEGRARDFEQRRIVAESLLRPETTPQSLYEDIKNFTGREHGVLSQIFGPKFDVSPRAVSEAELKDLGLTRWAARGRGIQAAVQEAIDRDEAALREAPNRTAALEIKNRLDRRLAFMARMREAEERVTTQVPMHEEDLRAGQDRVATLTRAMEETRDRYKARRAKLWETANNPAASEAEREDAFTEIERHNAEEQAELSRLAADRTLQETANTNIARSLRLYKNLGQRPKNIVMQPAGEFPVKSVFTPSVTEPLSRYLQAGANQLPKGMPRLDLTRLRRPEDIEAFGKAKTEAERAAIRQQAFRNNVNDFLSHPTLGLRAESSFWNRRFEALRKAAGDDQTRPIDEFRRAQRGEERTAPPNARLLNSVLNGDPHGERVAAAKENNIPVAVVKNALPTPDEIKLNKNRAKAIVEYNTLQQVANNLDPTTELGQQARARLDFLQKQLGDEPAPKVEASRSALDPRREKETDCQ